MTALLVIASALLLLYLIDRLIVSFVERNAQRIGSTGHEDKGQR